jgi:bleomycin hydrolase
MKTRLPSFLFLIQSTHLAAANKMRICIAAATLLAAVPLQLTSAGSSEPGSLSPQLIHEIQSNFKMDQQTRVKHNAITNNDINSLALNRKIVQGTDGHFSHRIDFKGITNQKSSGRCWLFAGLNTMRPRVIHEKNLPQFEFSTAYLQFWDKMEKSNLFLEYMIEMRETNYLDREWELVHKWTMSDGGWWNFVVDLVEKYGVVPKDVMPETQSSENTRIMNRVLDRKLRNDAVKIRAMHKDGATLIQLREHKRKALAQIYRFLAINLGQPPTEFEWRYEIKMKGEKDSKDIETAAEKSAGTKSESNKKQTPKPAIDITARQQLSPRVKYTPKTFYKQFVNVPLGDYVCISNDPTNAYNKHFQYKRSRNMFASADMDFVNLPIDALKTAAMKSVLANEPVWFAADVGKDQSSKLGIMAHQLYDYDPLFDFDTTISKADRVRFRSGGSNHAMVFMGVDVHNGKPLKWLVENSWGTDRGDKGKWTLYNSWFNEHVYQVIINKRHLSKKTLKIFKEKPAVLPAWYPGASTSRTAD